MRECLDRRREPPHGAILGRACSHEKGGRALPFTVNAANATIRRHGPIPRGARRTFAWDNEAPAAATKSPITRRRGNYMGNADEQHRNFVFFVRLERLGPSFLKAPSVVAVLVAIATILGLIGVFKLQVDDSLSELFRTNTEEFRRYEAIDRRFPSSEYDVLVVVEGPDLLKRKQLEAFAGLTTELQLVDGVAGLVSMLSARGKPDASVTVAPPLGERVVKLPPIRILPSG